MKVAIDENVLAVANDIRRLLHDEEPICPQASDACREACAEFLAEALRDHQIILDSADLVFSYYRRKASMAGQPGSADAFLMALYQNSYNEERVLRVDLPNEAGFGLPENFVHGGFDQDDMIYVALARARLPAAVVNAVDSDYHNFAAEITALGPTIRELC